MITIRLGIPDDAIDILRWRNDSQTRAMSWSDGVVDPADHMEWFSAAVADQEKIFLIGQIDGNKIGMIRFDALLRDKQSWRISIIIAPESRGLGHGVCLLTRAITYFHLINPRTILVAEVKTTNIASRRLFEKLGFSQVASDEEGIEYLLS